MCNRFGKERVLLVEGTDIAEKINELKACNAVIVCVGSDYKQEGENLANFSSSDKTSEKVLGGDRYSLRIPKEEVELIHKVCAECKNTVVNIIGGSAYIIEEWKDESAAIFESFYSGMEGGNALAELVAGDVNFSGHLPFTMAKNEYDYPPFLFPGDKERTIDYGAYHGYTLLDRENKKAAFPFGFGLSYTTFEYSDIKVENGEEAVNVTLKIKNSGSSDGKTVIQVYAGADGHQVKLLKGFKKVFLKAGEEKTVTVEVEKDDLKYYNPKIKYWYLEKEYNIYVGQDSEDALNNKFELKF